MKKFLIGFFITGLILIGLSTCIRTFGQTLPRKGWFGIGAAPAKNSSANQEGLAVTLVAPNSTGETLGIKVGDVILAIDGKPMNDTASFVAHAQSKIEGDQIEFTILSNGEKITKKGN